MSRDDSCGPESFPLENGVETKTAEKKKLEQFDTPITRKFECQFRSYHITTDGSPLLPHARTPLLFSPPQGSLNPRFLSSRRQRGHSLKKRSERKKKKKSEGKRMYSPVPLFLASNLTPFSFLFLYHSMAPSNGRFMLMHLRPSRAGVGVYCLVARRLHIASIRRSQLPARHSDGKL